MGQEPPNASRGDFGPDHQRRALNLSAVPSS